METLLLTIAIVALIVTFAVIARRRPDVPIWKIFFLGGIVPKDLDKDDRE